MKVVEVVEVQSSVSMIVHLVWEVAGHCSHNVRYDDHGYQHRKLNCAFVESDHSCK